MNRLLLSSPAPWSIRGSSLDLDFLHNRAAINGYLSSLSSLLTGTRASTEYGLWADGHYSSFGSGVPCVTDLGFWSWQESTNLLLHSELDGGSGGAPTSWSANAGGGTATPSVYGLPGNAYSFTASATRPFISQNIAVSANTTYTGSLVVESNPNSITIQDLINIASLPTGATVTFPQGATTVPIAGTRITAVLTVSSTTGSPQFRMGAGTNANVTGTAVLSTPQFENLGFATPPIPTTTTTVTRAADIWQLQGPAATAALNTKAIYDQTNLIAGGTAPNIVHYNGGSMINYTSTPTQSGAGDGTNNVTATIGGSGTYAGPVKNAFGLDNTSLTAIANGGTKAIQSTSAWTTNATGTVYIGNRAAGDRALNGCIQRLVFGPVKGMFDNLTK